MRRVTFSVKDRGRLGHVRNLLSMAQLRGSGLPGRCEVETEGLFVTAESLCRSVRVDVFLASEELLEEYRVEGGTRCFGFGVGAVVEALSEGGEVEVTEEWMKVTCEAEGNFKISTKIRLTENLGRETEMEEQNYTTEVTMNGDLLQYLVQEIGNLSNGEVVVKLEIRGGGEMGMKCFDASSGMQTEIGIPSRSIKVEGGPVVVEMKSWVMLSLSKLLQTIGTALIRIQMCSTGIRIQHKPIIDSDSGCVFTLCASI